MTSCRSALQRSTSRSKRRSSPAAARRRADAVNLRRLIKLGHEIGSAGFAGALAVHIVLLSVMPAPSELLAYATLRGAIAAVGTWVLFPSLFLVLFSGLLAMMVNRAFHNAGWAW